MGVVHHRHVADAPALADLVFSGVFYLVLLVWVVVVVVWGGDDGEEAGAQGDRMTNGHT